MRGVTPSEGTQHQFLDALLEYIHTWYVDLPGSFSRSGDLGADIIECCACSLGSFFAANEFKAMLAFMVVHYDIKLAGDGSRPWTPRVSNISVGWAGDPPLAVQLLYILMMLGRCKRAGPSKSWLDWGM